MLVSIRGDLEVNPAAEGTDRLSAACREGSSWQSSGRKHRQDLLWGPRFRPESRQQSLGARVSTVLQSLGHPSALPPAPTESPLPARPAALAPQAWGPASRERQGASLQEKQMLTVCLEVTSLGKPPRI